MVEFTVSAVTVAFNSRGYIERAVKNIASAASKANLPVEIIAVVNDNRPYDFQGIKVKVIHNHLNLGFSRAANIGAKYTHGQWLLFFNPDITVPPDLFIKLGENLKKNIAGIIAPKIVNNDGNLQFNLLAEPNLLNTFLEQSLLYKFLSRILKHPQSNTEIYSHSQRVYAVSGTFMLIKKSLFNRLLGFDERFFVYYEDLDLCRRANEAGYYVYYNGGSKIYHARHHSTREEFDFPIFINSQILYLKKYYSGLYVKSILFILLLGQFCRMIYWSVSRSISKKHVEVISIILKELFRR